MNLISSLETIDEWKSYVKDNFSREASIYDYATVSQTVVKYKGQQFQFPKKVVFESGWLSVKKSITQTQSFNIGDELVTITEKKQKIAFGPYKRTTKYSGELYEILKDFVGGQIIEVLASREVLSPVDNPQYGIDSLQKWPSHILVFDRNNSAVEIEESIDFPLWNEFLSDFGIHYWHSFGLQNYTVVFFPMPYVKIVENKISRKEKEFVLLVLEFNSLPLFYNRDVRISLHSLIRDVKDKIIYDKRDEIKFAKSSFQVLEIIPDYQTEIGYAAFSIWINGTLVAKTSGYYIRDIKIQLNVKSDG